VSPGPCRCLGLGSDGCDPNQYLPPAVVLGPSLVAEPGVPQGFLQELHGQPFGSLDAGGRDLAPAAVPLLDLISNQQENSHA
jgi:hypothetical protein